MRVKVVDVPPGEAPLWVRKAWVGCVLEVVRARPGRGVRLGARLGRPENGDGYRVRTDHALSVLKQLAPEAAEWWPINAPYALGQTLVFSRDVCEVVQ